MKRAILNISFFVLGGFLLSSCIDKRYDCYCVDTAKQEFLEDAVAKSKKKAADKCKALEISGKFERTTTCQLGDEQ